MKSAGRQAGRSATAHGRYLARRVRYARTALSRPTESKGREEGGDTTVWVPSDPMVEEGDLLLAGRRAGDDGRPFDPDP